MNYFEILAKEIKILGLKDLDLSLIEKAYKFAEKAHEGQFRKSGEPYISHPVGVAEVLLELNPDTSTLVCALLHDTLEDTSVTEEVILKEFGEDVFKIVNGLTKVSKVESIGFERQVNSLRKMFIAMASDLRVVLIKLADRLHNLRTIGFLSREKQIRIAQESLEIYAPISERLGVFKLKTTLEDEAFKILEPDYFKKIDAQLGEIEHTFMVKASDKISSFLKENNFLNFEISGRIKGKYSIYKKMKGKKVEDIYDIYDIFAIRLIVSSVEDCYRALGLIHKNWTPISHRFKDYIATPKPNGYESLHTVVVGLGKELANEFRPVEVQIRTKEMHFQAEYGVAAHWSYKEGEKNKKVGQFLANLIDLEHQIEDHSEFMSQIQVDALSKRIFVLTPKGEIKDLPDGATPIDFAFAIHSDIGLECVGAQINNKNTSLFNPLQNGDTVKVLTRKGARPSPSWLGVVKTSQARSSIKKWLNEQNQDSIFEDGKKILNNCLVRFGKEELDSNFTQVKNYKGKTLNKKERIDLIEKVGKGSILSLEALSDVLIDVKKKKKKEEKIPIKETERVGILVEGELKNNTKLAENCCNPKSGDEIIAYVTRGSYIGIHKKTCSFIHSADPKRFLKARWENQAIEYTSKIKLNFAHGKKVVPAVLDILDIPGIDIELVNYQDDLHPTKASILIGVAFFKLNLFSIAIEKIKDLDGVLEVKIESLSQ